MAPFVQTNCKLYVASFDLSGYMNAIAVDYGSELQDATTYTNDTRIRKGGLKTAAWNHQGFWEAGSDGLPDDTFYSRVATAAVPTTICPATGAVGETAYLMRAIEAQYSLGGAIGEMTPFACSGEVTEAFVRGTILKAAGNVTATANGSGYQVGAATASQTVHACLHVLSASGTSPTLDVTIESDSADTWGGGETTRLTFTQATGVTSEYLTLAGAVTDDWWRVAYTIGGSDTPTFSFVLTLGIL